MDDGRGDDAKMYIEIKYPKSKRGFYYSFVCFFLMLQNLKNQNQIMLLPNTTENKILLAFTIIV